MEKDLFMDSLIFITLVNVLILFLLRIFFSKSNTKNILISFLAISLPIVFFKIYKFATISKEELYGIIIGILGLLSPTTLMSIFLNDLRKKEEE